MDKGILDSSDDGIVIRETLIKLSDEKLKGLLLKTYERAIADASVFKLRSHYGAFLSVSLTLLVALSTSSFHDIGSLSGQTLTLIAWAVFAICATLGVLLLLLNYSTNTKRINADRDAAVDSLFAQYVIEKNKES